MAAIHHPLFAAAQYLLIWTIVSSQTSSPCLAQYTESSHFISQSFTFPSRQQQDPTLLYPKHTNTNHSLQQILSHFSMGNTDLLVASKPRKYTKSGIGGAGNIRPASSIPVLPSTPRCVPTLSKGVFYTGIGGAGNSRSHEERASLSPYEEEVRSSTRKQNAAGSWHFGIGGAGNRSTSVDSRSPSPSMTEARGGLMRRFSGYFGGKRDSIADDRISYDEKDIQTSDD